MPSVVNTIEDVDASQVSDDLEEGEEGTSTILQSQFPVKKRKQNASEDIYAKALLNIKTEKLKVLQAKRQKKDEDDEYLNFLRVFYLTSVVCHRYKN